MDMVLNMNEWQHTAAEASVELAPGTWRVDGEHSSAAFSARGFWGGLAVNGRFSDLSGAATTGADGGLTGELVIPTETLSTGLGFRDRHLKSRQFFHVRRHTEIRFVAQGLADGGAGVVIHGRLSVRDLELELELPVEFAQEGGDRLVLSAHTSLERAALGVGHSPIGMIRGPARVQARIVLERQT